MIKIKKFGLVEYMPIYNEMIRLNESISMNDHDEFWCLQHQPIFTLGAAASYNDIINNTHNITILKVDRGGKVTYHGPGQIVIYTMVNIKRLNLSVRDYVIKLENGIINYLNSYYVFANIDRNSPGIYIDNKKIASIGLKLRNNCTYHGISFNLNMDLTPFDFINICGHKELKATQLCNYVPTNSFKFESDKLCNYITQSIYN